MNGKKSTWELTPTKEKIALVALRLFSKKGFKGTTIKDIARKVGITEGAIYRHFTSKEEIVNYLLARITGDIKTLIESKVLTQKDIKSQVSKLVEVLINYAFDNPDAFRFLTVYHILRHNGNSARLPGNILLNLFREAHRQGKLKISPEVALSLIIGAVERLFILWELKVIDTPRRRLIEEVKSATVKALFGC
ncbi:TetR/AcrR family transcriptional regulator [Hydrogenivirga sp.]